MVASTGDVAHCLNAGAMGRIDYETETMVAHTLSAARGKACALAAYQETYVAHALRADGFDASEDGTGRRTPLVPIAFHGSQDPDISGDVTHPLGRNGGLETCVAFDIRGREHGSQMEGPHDTANMRAASGGSSRSYVAQTWGVRRLMPVECERLQGFPDGYTAITYRKKPAADGPRYKALGNSMAVPCMRWIGNRIEMVRNAVGDHHA